MTNEERKHYESILNALRKTNEDLRKLNNRLEKEEIELKIDEYCSTHTKEESYEDEYFNDLLDRLEELERGI